jgi:hypothetical protein
MTPTRGERNNNPCNVRQVAGVHWRGERAQDDDPAFEEFESSRMGIRCAAKVFLAYQRKHHLQTVRQLITRWAPGTENDTESYVRDVAKRLSIDANSPLNLEDPFLMRRLVEAVITHENGRNIYTHDVVVDGVRAAYEE